MTLHSTTSSKFLVHGLAFAFLSIVTTNVLADNKAALKDAIGNSVTVAEAKAIDTKSTDTKEMTPAQTLTPDADFKKLDSNSDKKISLNEAIKDKALSKQFDISDMNHDGAVSLDEYVTFKTNIASQITPNSTETSTTH